MSTVDALKEILASMRDDPELARTLPDTASLINDVELDSLELLQFMLEIEAELGIQIDFEKLDYEDLESLERLAAFLDLMPSTADEAKRS